MYEKNIYGIINNKMQGMNVEVKKSKILNSGV